MGKKNRRTFSNEFKQEAANRAYGNIPGRPCKSILCQEDTAYLLELVRYIHWNPLRTRQIASLEHLA